MCGIGGILYHHNKPDLDVLKKMSDRLAHRGPDGEGLFHDSTIGLVHRRLAIIDLSERAAQPMKDTQSGCVVTYNGEIYNFKYLRQTLSQAGIVFQTSSDTEVLLKGIQLKGIDFLNDVNGDFAFGFWNPNTQELLIARDRFGVKPLYYYHDEKIFAFSSEVKPLLELGISENLDVSSIESFFALRYSRGENTFFDRIKRVPPATVIKINKNRKISQFEYWNLYDLPESADSYPEAVEAFGSCLKKSVQERMVSDVEVGAFLSGGVDSSSIVSLMKHYHSNKIQTFTYNIKSGVNEVEQAKKLASKLDLRHHVLEHGADDFTLTELAQYYLEEPIGDSIVVPWYRLSQFARKNVKVVLSGEGADEILLGYAHQNVLGKYAKLKKAVPESLIRMSVATLGFMPFKLFNWLSPYPIPINSEMIDRLKGLVNSRQGLPEDYLYVAELFTREERTKLLNTKYLPSENSVLEFNRSCLSKRSDVSYIKKLLLFDLQFWLSDYGLHRVDKMSMAHALEVRVPFLDHRLVEKVVSFKERFIFDEKHRKKILRDYVDRNKILSHEESFRKKHPFHLPAEKLYSQDFFVFAKSVLNKNNIDKYGILNSKFVIEFIGNIKNDFIEYKKLIALMSFQIWCDLYLDRKWKHLK